VQSCAAAVTEVEGFAPPRYRRRTLILHVQVAGVASTLPAASVAQTEKVCLPVFFTLWRQGDVQGEAALRSSWQV